jgi:folate-dependent phosphoribosylglycinamide formyltransferase PurN
MTEELTELQEPEDESTDAMRVTIVAEESVLYTPEMADYLLTELPEDVDVRGLLPLEKEASRLDNAGYYLDFLGPYASLWFGFQVGKRKLLDLVNSPQTVSSVARDHDIPVLGFDRVNHPEHVRFLRQEDIDVVVSLGTEERFGPDLLEGPNEACLTLQHGDLQESNPGFWALKNGEDEATVTVHEIAEGTEIGPILAQGHVPIRESESWDSLRRRFSPYGAELLIGTLRDIDEGTVDRRPVVRKSRPSQSPRTQDGKAFRDQGGRFL